VAQAERLDNEQWRRVDALLVEALELPSDARDAWLEALAPPDREFAPLLRRLLNRDGGARDEFLQRPVTASTLAAVGDELDSELAGRTVGPYTLIRELGAGGMGTVWLARRTDGAISRPVALKLPRYGWGRGVEARLQAERESLASLEHPNIARIYDAGTTAGGRPYFAMEYVDGMPIDDYVRRHASSVDDCLRLFLQIARAVAHAHARLIVHRDLKPSNVLVTPDGEVRLLDFGAAKLLAAGDTGPSDLTRESGGAMSPAYAAPEQLRGETITVATDVWSLGVVLFELLAGARPFTRSGADLRRVVEAPAPLASHAAVDRSRARVLRGDIDAILARALAEDPPGRYASVDAMAEDVRRYLAGEPVQARRVTAWYRASRFVARHRLAVGASAAAIVALVGALGMALWQAKVARAEAARAARVTEFVSSIFTHATPRNGVGGAVTAVDVLSDASRRIEVELANEPAAAAQIGTIVGQSLDDLGVPEGLESLMTRTVAHAYAAWGRLDPRTLRAEVLLAEAETYRDPDAALQRLDRILPELRAGMPATVETMLDALRMDSFVRAKLNRRDASYASLDEAIAIAEERFGALDERTLWLLGLRSNTYGRFGEAARQLRAAEIALERTNRALGDQRPHNAMIAMERWYAEALRANGRPGDAVPILRRVVADQEKLDAAPTVRVRNARYALANALIASGRIEEGLPMLREAVQLERRQNPADSDDRRAYADGLTQGLVQAGFVDEAWQQLLYAGAVAERVGNDIPRNSVARLLRRARLLAMRNRSAESLAAVDEAMRRSTDLPPMFAALARLARALDARLQGHPRDVLDALAAIPDRSDGEVPSALTAAAAGERAAAYLELGDLASARAAAESCGTAQAAAQIEPSVLTHSCDVARARAALADGDARRARALLDRLCARWDSSNASSPWHGEALVWRAAAATALGDTAAARADRARGLTLLRASSLPQLRALAARVRGS
jgi:tetratricopeptide (TPR) repeat protein